MTVITVLAGTAFGLFVALFSLPHASAQTADEINNLEHFWAYGRSPPVYPSPIATGLGEWADAFTQAYALVTQMTNEEKMNVTIGYYGAPNGCSGNSGGVPRLDYPGLCLNDAGNGLRGTDGTTGYPSALHVGAAWNRNLAYNRGQYMGAEFRRKGASMALGPVVGPLGRVAEGGRNWEGTSNDPYLAGQLVSETIRGMQESTIACVKHFVAYEQETNRQPIGVNSSVSSNLDDFTMHEVYLWPFQDALRAGAGAVMCSYNNINGSNACQNSKSLNGLLKTELGFQGPVVSDWGGQHSGIASANGGLDLAMPNSPFWSMNNLTNAVRNGTLPQARLDDMAARIIAAWYKFAPVADPGFGIPTSLLTPHSFVDARDPASRSTVFQGAVEGHVLVKNINNSLPLRAPKVLSLFGYDAVAPLQNDWPASGYGKWTNGWESVNANDTDVLTVFTIPQVYQFDPNRPQAALNGTIISGGGSGATTPAYINAPYDAFQQQAYQDGTWLAWDFTSQDPVVEAASDACVVMINEFATEGEDRVGLADPYSDVLVQNVAANCSNTIVVIHNAGIRVVDAWIDHPNITALVYAHLPGQDSGRSLIEVLYGYQAPSGKLPYTVAKSASDYGTLLRPDVPTNTSDYYVQSNFTEGVYIDYKAFIAQNITPRYEFGFGLSYTTFAYTNLSTSFLPGVPMDLLPPYAPLIQGGNPTLFDVIATVDCVVTNTGTFPVAAAEVTQLYIGIPNGLPKQLRGFSKQSMDAGKSVVMEFDLTRRDMSTWDVYQQEWVLQRGEYNVYVGASVLDIRLEGSLIIR